MINVSNEFRELMKERTDFQQSAQMTLADGTSVSLDSSDFTLSNNSIVEGAGESSFPLGSAIEKTIQLEITNDDGRFSTYDFYGAKIELTLSFALSDSTESIACGQFTVLEPYTKGSIITITAVDDMYKADVEYDTSLEYPASLSVILLDSCNTTGITISSVDFANNDFIADEKPEGITHRQLIGYIAMIAGGNAHINRHGQLEIMSYDLWNEHTGASPAEWHELSDWLNTPKLDTDDILITGIQTVFTEDNTEKTLLSGAEGYVIQVENPLMSGKEQTALSLIAEKIVGTVFRQFEGDHIAYPIAEFMDAIVIIDRDGSTYNSFITDLDFSFRGITVLKNSSETVIRNGRSFTSYETKTLQKTKKLIAVEKSEREKAVQNLAAALAKSSGLYVTPVEQEDKSIIYYMHNKSSLEESDIVWKYTAEAFAVSVDGGKTYPYGFSVTGDMITKILNTEGVNADWINTGTINVKDADGNVLFFVDIDTKSVKISGDSVFIGDKTVTQAISDAANSAKNLSMHLSNDLQSIPVNSDGEYEEFPDCSTTVSVLYGSDDVSDACSYIITKSDYVDGSWDRENLTYTVTALGSDSGWVDIQATYAGTMRMTKRFSLSKVYAGSDGRAISIEASAALVKIENGGVLNPSSLEFAAYYQGGNSDSREAYTGRFLVEETEDGVSWETVYSSDTDEETAVYSLYSFLVDAGGNVIVDSDGYGIGVKRDISEIRCSLYAAGGFDILLDRQTISVVKSADALTQNDIFNLLTNNGEALGIYKEGNQIYINATYIRSGTFVAGGANNQNGRYEVRDSGGNVIGSWDKDGFSAEKGSFTGTISGSTVEGSVISGSTFETKNTDSTEKITIENATQKFYSDAEWDSYAGEIKPNKLYVLVDVDESTSAENEVAGIDISANYWLRFLVQNTVTGTMYKQKTTLYGQLVAESLSLSGTKSRIVETPDFGVRTLYCYETPTPMFGDIGSGVINEDGFCVVSIDDIFSETVNCNVEYHVFLQKEGEGDLWVAEKEFTHFTVKGTPNLPFSWEVKAYQRDYEYLFLDDEELRPDSFYSDSDEVERIMDAELEAYDEELEDLV